MPGYFFKAAFEIATALHQILDVEDVGKEELEELEEFGLGVGQIFVGEKLDEVAEVVAAVKGYPRDLVEQDDAGRGEYLGEMHGIDAVLEILLEHDARLGEQIDRLLGVHVLVDVEVKVELKRGRLHRHVALLVHEREAQLNDLQQVHIALETLILIVGRLEVTADPCHYARKLSVLYLIVFYFICQRCSIRIFKIESLRTIDLPSQHTGTFAQFCESS